MVDRGSGLEPTGVGAAGVLEGDGRVEPCKGEALEVLRSRMDGGNDEDHTQEERRGVRRVEGGTAGVVEAVELVGGVGGRT